MTSGNENDREASGATASGDDAADVNAPGSDAASVAGSQAEIVAFDPAASERDRWRAIVLGEDFTEWPDDLYIPPEALEVFLEAFEGPLDLLLWLIRKQNLNILDIPVARITEQYMQYVEMMRALKLDLAAEYMLMAATLAEIKSRMLLPRPELPEGEEIDPRTALVQQLQQYERFRTVALEIEDLPRLERDIFVGRAKFEDVNYEAPDPDVAIGDLVKAFQNVLEIAARNKSFTIGREVMSIRERMVVILETLQTKSAVRFIDLFDLSEGRLGLVVSFSAILELFKEQSLSIIQDGPFEPITVETRNAAAVMRDGSDAMVGLIDDDRMPADMSAVDAAEVDSEVPADVGESADAAIERDPDDLAG